jgi:predicted O-methyltransferase YrrM
VSATLSIGLRALVAAQGWRLRDRAPAVRNAAAFEVRAGQGGLHDAIAALRKRLENDHTVIVVDDHGAGTRGRLGPAARQRERSVSAIYARAAASPAWGRFLFGLVRELRPRRVLELGTNLGVSASHIAAALALAADGGRLWTIEGDAGLAKLARGNLRDAGLHETTDVIVGRFDDVLPEVLAAHGPFDMAFVDGHHDEGATLRYWAMMRQHLAPGAAVLFDDIEPGRPVRRAWRRIVSDECPNIDGWADLIGLGILFLRDGGAARRAAESDLVGTVHGQ